MSCQKEIFSTICACYCVLRSRDVDVAPPDNNKSVTMSYNPEVMMGQIFITGTLIVRAVSCRQLVLRQYGS